MLLFWCRLLVNTLAKAPHSGNSEDVPYKSSCLTHLLRESIGGNSKLTVICAVFPDNKYLTFVSIQNLNHNSYTHIHTCGHCVVILLKLRLKLKTFTVFTDSSCECSNQSEILQTLRFGERVKSIRNQPVINEITEDAVNDLSDQIRQLKVSTSLECVEFCHAC